MSHNNSSSEEEPSASASEDEQTSGSETDEVSDSHSDNDNNNIKQPLKQPLIIPPPKPTIKPSAPAPEPSDSESEESGSDTDSDSPVKNTDIKPIGSKPMERETEVMLVKKSEGGSGTIPQQTSKRPAAGSVGEKDPKKGKSNTPTTEDESKNPKLFQRLWSEDDEIAILKGMIDYKAESGENVIADTGAFHEFIKESLHVEVSRGQLVDKIRRLKKKFVNNVGREKNGKDRSFSKSHEQKGYELSKLVWGTDSKKNQSKKDGNGASTSGVTLAKSNGLDDYKAVSLMEVEKNMDISRFVRYGRDGSPILPEEIVKAGMELLEGSKRVELEERWRNLKKQELELYLKKMDLIKEQALVVLDAVNSSGR